MKQRAVSITEKDPGNNEQGIVTGRKTADKMETQKKENQPKKKPNKTRERMKKKKKRGKKIQGNKTQNGGIKAAQEEQLIGQLTMITEKHVCQ